MAQKCCHWPPKWSQNGSPGPPGEPFRGRPEKNTPQAPKKHLSWRAGHAFRSRLCSPNTVFSFRISVPKHLQNASKSAPHSTKIVPKPSQNTFPTKNCTQTRPQRQKCSKSARNGLPNADCKMPGIRLLTFFFQPFCSLGPHRRPSPETVPQNTHFVPKQTPKINFCDDSPLISMTPRTTKKLFRRGPHDPSKWVPSMKLAISLGKRPQQMGAIDATCDFPWKTTPANGRHCLHSRVRLENDPSKWGH